jgi:hypothetical protein
MMRGMATPRERISDPRALLPTPAELQRLHADAQERLARRRAGDPGHGLVDVEERLADEEDLAELLDAEPPPFRVLALPGALDDL